MKVIEVKPDDLVLSDDLRRSGSAKQFEERLRASIEEIGLAEPIKVAKMPTGQYLVVDGTMRLRAIHAIRESDATAFCTIPAYVTNYECRYEIRYQTDIYQDLLPSQLATLVEHLHQAERVRKADIARYIGVSPATLRNYTGLWRLMQRDELFAGIVQLMDVGVIPSSNPFAWLRLTDEGLRLVLEENLAGEDETAEQWLDRTILAARQGQVVRYIISYVESITGGLGDKYYREDEEVRSAKRELGLLRATGQAKTAAAAPAVPKRNISAALERLKLVSRDTKNPVLKAAAQSFRAYLQ
jgi:ParB-like chromosome segregation protein Spo0J